MSMPLDAQVLTARRWRVNHLADIEASIGRDLRAAEQYVKELQRKLADAESAVAQIRERYQQETAEPTVLLHVLNEYCAANGIEIPPDPAQVCGQPGCGRPVDRSGTVAVHSDTGLPQCNPDDPISLTASPVRPDERGMPR